MVTPIVQLLLSGYAHRNMIPAHTARIQRVGKGQVARSDWPKLHYKV